MGKLFNGFGYITELNKRTMWTIVKIKQGYGVLVVQNDRLTPDWSYHLYAQKNGKAKLSVFQGACEKPMVTYKFDNIESAEHKMNELIMIQNFVKVKTFGEIV